MRTKGRELASRIVEAVLRDLKGRQGIGDAFDQIDKAIYDAELVPELRAVVERELNADESRT